MRVYRRHFLKMLSFSVLLAGVASSASAKGESMEPKKFWEIVGTVKKSAGNDLESRPRILEQKLSALSTPDIQAFQRTYESLLLNANRWSLWGAAYLMNGGCSDDGFKYFRDWLISEGQDVYERAIADPDSLASFAKRDFFELELYGYSALHAFAQAGAGELERDFSLEIASPTGAEWREDDLPKLFPKLAAKYL